jgi:hypothetical protein
VAIKRISVLFFCLQLSASNELGAPASSTAFAEEIRNSQKNGVKKII